MWLSYEAMVQLRLKYGKMSEGHSGGHAESESVGSFQESTWRERRRQKRHEDREREREEEEFGLREGSDQTHRTMSGASRHGQFDERDQELEQLRRLVRDLELEARGRRQRRDRDNEEMKDGSVGSRGGEEFGQPGSRQCQDLSLFPRIMPTQELLPFSRVATTSGPFTFKWIC